MATRSVLHSRAKFPPPQPPLPLDHSPTANRQNHPTSNPTAGAAYDEAAALVKVTGDEVEGTEGPVNWVAVLEVEGVEGVWGVVGVEDCGVAAIRLVVGVVGAVGAVGVVGVVGAVGVVGVVTAVVGVVTVTADVVGVVEATGGLEVVLVVLKIGASVTVFEYVVDFGKALDVCASNVDVSYLDVEYE